jgi:hypothetical protein
MDDKMTLMDVENLLKDVHPERAFVLKDGSSIKNLQELYSVLQGMESHVFEHHVNEERNDFGNWVKDVHKDYRLANSLFSAGTKDEAVKAIGSRIYEIEKKIRPEKKVVPALRQKQHSMVVVAPQKAGPAPVKAVDLPAKEENPVLEDAGELEKKVIVEAKIEKKIESKSAAISEEGVSRRLPDKDDPCEELIKFAEEKGFAGRLIGEVTSVFTRPDIRGFASDMKKVFASGSEADDSVMADGADQEDDDESSGPELSGAAAVKAIKASQGDDDKKDEILSYLKKVYR